MATQIVNNPSNSMVPTSLPYTTPKRMQLISKPNSDKFNTGIDYKDEIGAPLLEATAPQTQPFSAKHVTGLTNALTVDEIQGLSDPDKAAQGNSQIPMNEGVVVDLDAKLITSTQEEMKQGIFKESHFPTLESWMSSPNCRILRESRAALQVMAQVAKKSDFKEGNLILDPRQTAIFQGIDKQIQARMREAGNKLIANLKESAINGSDPFLLDGCEGGLGFDQYGNGRAQDYIPIMGGPWSRQLYMADYLQMQALAFECWTHNPLSKRIVKTIAQFVLGKGVKISVINADLATGKVSEEPDPKTGEINQMEEILDYREECQEILEDHWTRNGMVLRSKQILRDLIIFGEQFPRYFNTLDGLKLRQIDPSTVWEIVSDPDDNETQFYLHQQYSTRYQNFVTIPGIETMKYIIRQVPADKYYHMKINTVSGEMRGRSELFAILGWLRRLKEFATDRVIRNKVANLFCLDIAVDGGADAVMTAQAQFAAPPTPGSLYIHNKASEIKGIRAEVGSGDVLGDWEMILTIIACGAGISQEYLGLPIAGSKAGALIGTEPDIKTFEDYQEMMEAFFMQDAQRCFDRARELRKIPSGLKIKVEVTFPEIAGENRSEKMKDIAFAESMSWISHKRSSEMAAKELRISTYEYDEEQENIINEDVEAQIKLNQTYAQITKGQDAAAAGGGAGAPGMPPGVESPAPELLGESPPAQLQDPNIAATESNKKSHWHGDPRDVREAIIRESKRLNSKKRIRTLESKLKTFGEAQEFGVKGMKWGERKEDSSSLGISSFRSEDGYTVEHSKVGRPGSLPQHIVTLYSPANKKIERKTFDSYSGSKRDVANKVRNYLNKKYGIENAAGIKEAAVPGLGSRKTMLSRKKYRQASPNKRRDQHSMDRNDIITKGRRAVKRGYNESSPRETETEESQRTREAKGNWGHGGGEGGKGNPGGSTKRDSMSDAPANKKDWPDYAQKINNKPINPNVAALFALKINTDPNIDLEKDQIASSLTKAGIPGLDTKMGIDSVKEKYGDKIGKVKGLSEGKGKDRKVIHEGNQKYKAEWKELPKVDKLSKDPTEKEKSNNEKQKEARKAAELRLDTKYGVTSLREERTNELNKIWNSPEYKSKFAKLDNTSVEYYHGEQTAQAKVDKFARVRALAPERDGIENQIMKDRKSSDPETKDNADIAYLIMKMGTRPDSGGGSKKGSVTTYGATSLQARHLFEDSDGVGRIKFVGKKGVLQSHRITTPFNNEPDPELYAMLKERAKGKDPKDSLFPNTSYAKNVKYIGNLGTAAYTGKDYRTLLGTQTAQYEIDKVKRIPKTETAFKELRKKIGTIVSKKLGNNPSEALNSYIDSDVWIKWQSNLPKKEK